MEHLEHDEFDLTDGLAWLGDFFCDEPATNEERPAFMLDSKRFFEANTPLQQQVVYLENEALYTELERIAQEQHISLTSIADICTLLCLPEDQLSHEAVKAFFSLNEMLNNL